MASNNQGGNNHGGNKQSGNQGNQGNQGGNSNRGFASMDPEKQREIASQGGKAAHASGNAHEFTSEEARRAGSMSHKNDGNQQSNNSGGSRQSGNQGNQGNQGSQGGNSGGKSTRGGTPEQHAEAGRQSHKNDKN